MKLIEEEKNERPYSLVAFAWRRLRRNMLAVFGMSLIGLALLVSLLGYLICPDQSPDADTHIEEIATMHPGFSCQILKIRNNEPDPSTGILTLMMKGEKNPYTIKAIKTYWFEGNSMVWEEFIEGKGRGQFFRKNLADLVYAIDPALPHLSDTIKGVEEFYIYGATQKLIKSRRELMTEAQGLISKRTFWLGTDNQGRDMLSRLTLGTRISLFVGLISVVISLVIGIFMGAISGFFRGWVDDLIMWLINVVWSIPTLLLVIAISLVLGRGMLQVFIAVGLTMWVETARVVRGQILSVREKEFVEAGRALGYSNFRIIMRHVLPNVMGPVIVITANNFASAILIEAGLSFLGIGAERPTPSWGMMINEYQGAILYGNGYLAVVPGLAIMLLVLAFMFVGNGLRDAIDTKMSEDNIMT